MPKYSKGKIGRINNKNFYLQWHLNPQYYYPNLYADIAVGLLEKPVHNIPKVKVRLRLGSHFSGSKESTAYLKCFAFVYTAISDMILKCFSFYTASIYVHKGLVEFTCP